MISKNQRPICNPSFLLHKCREGKLKFDDSKRYHVRRLRGRIFSSLALMLKVCANDYQPSENENFILGDSVNRVYKYFGNVVRQHFTAVSAASNQIRELRVDSGYVRESPDKTKSWYLSFVSRYIRNCRRTSENSLCKRMMRIAPSEPRIFFVGEGTSRQQRYARPDNQYHQHDLVSLGCVLVKLNRYLRQRCQRLALTSKLHACCKIPRAEYNSHIRHLRCMRDKSTSVGLLVAPPRSPQLMSTPTTTSRLTPTHRDKAVQCSKHTEFLKVSPDVKFFSQSSLVINMDNTKPAEKSVAVAQRCSTGDPLQRRQNAESSWMCYSGTNDLPSFEYVANCRPEFRRQIGPDVPNLRSFSASAIFGVRRRAESSPNPLSERYNGVISSRKNKSRMGVWAKSDRLRETIRRTEDEIKRYSDFFEEDLTTLHQRQTARPKKSYRFRSLCRDDVTAVKKVLLEDYMTEVKEIIRSKSYKQEHETEILESVKRRMDKDLTEPHCTSSSSLSPPRRSSYLKPALPQSTSAESAQSACNDSWHSHCNERRIITSRRSNSSFVMAREMDSRNMPGLNRRRRRCGSRRCSTLRGSCSRDGSAIRGESRSPWRKESHTDDSIEVKSCVSCIENKTQSLGPCKSDPTSSPVKSCQSLDSGVHVDFLRPAGDWPSSDDGSSQQCIRTADGANLSVSSCTDEVLCQRVESAVRKFTEDLILCERRANDRSRSNWRRRDKPEIHTSTSDQSETTITGGTFNYMRNIGFSSEDEHITEISTPSLVSLTDSESSTTSLTLST